MTRTENKAKKLAVLQLIKEQNAVLFGSFQNNKTSKLEKQQAWDGRQAWEKGKPGKNSKPGKKAQSLGLASLKRTWTYARDHIFGQWKCRTLAKRDNSKKTGTGGEKDVIMDEVDEIILDIIGSESAMVNGLDLPEADGIQSFLETPPRATVKQKPSVSERRFRKRKIDNDSLISLKKQVLESELYKNKLEILKLEKELKFLRSKFTFKFEKSNRIIELENDNSNNSGFSKNNNDENVLSSYIGQILD